MGRRFKYANVTAAAVVGLCLATGMVGARQDDLAAPAPAPSRAAGEPNGKRAPVGQKPVPLPTATATAGPTGSNLGPEPPSLGAPPADALPPAEPLPAPAELPGAPGTLDPAVEPAQTPAKSSGKPGPSVKPPAIGSRTIPPQLAAQVAPPTTPLAESTATPPPADDKERHAFAIPIDQMPMGKQSVGLSVDVIAPQVLNINQVANLKVVVRNSGTSDAKGVVVRDELPESLTFLSSQPEAQRIDALLSWQLGTVQAGSERVILLSVKPTKVGPFDHAATVTMMTGGKSRTIVREPKLKVEQTATPSKVLRGQPVNFKISVSNPGDGPARGVTVQAKLTAGLRHESGEPNSENLFEQTIPLIGPGEHVTLDTLVADTLQGGEQSCLVVAQSADVVTGSPDAKSLQTVNVVEPQLTVKLNGPEKRFTETLATYDLTLENPGTAPAKNVRVFVTLPLSGRLYQLPSGAQFNAQTRKLTWTRPQLDKGEKLVLSFQIRMGGVGLYTITAEAKADGVPQVKPDVFKTDVEGLADVNCVVTEKRRVVDIDGETTYLISIDNVGTKEATQLLVSAQLSDNVEPLITSGTDEQARYDNTQHAVLFPKIERLLPGKKIELGIKVKATKPGIASCRVFLVTQEMSEKIDAVARFTVVPIRRQ